MASINFTLEPVDAPAIDLNDLPTRSSGSKFPKAGRYVLQTTSQFTDESFQPNKARTALTAQIDPTIVGPTNEGYTLRFTRISAKPYVRNGKSTSQLAEYLKACGQVGSVPADPQGQADLVEQTASATFEAQLDWEAYEKSTGRQLSGMKNFPKNDDGEPVPYFYSEVDKDEFGQPKRVYANLRIKDFIAQA